MRAPNPLPGLAWGAALALLVLAGWLSYERHFRPAELVLPSEESHPHETKERVLLSPQARANLRLVVKPISPQTYWRTLRIPGTVVERRGKSHRGVTTPIAGVVKQIFAVPGDTVKPQAELFALGLTSEYLQTSQTELNRTAQEVKITQAQKARLEKIAESIAGVRLIELQNQLDRLNAARKAQRNDLALRGLTAAQIEQIEQGQFVKEIIIRAPAQRPGEHPSYGPAAEAAPAQLFELDELKVQLGEQVQAGQVLALVADHQRLYLEGRGFREDTALIERSTVHGWPVRAVFAEETADAWPPLKQELTIQYLANTLDPVSQTFPFYLPLTNQFRDYTRDGKTYRLWRYRPGQRLRLEVRVADFEDVFVLPLEAVVREGAESYVFRQNGDLFERKPVHVVYEDSAHVALANDGSILAGSYLAQNAAAALNRALKASTASAEHGHSHEH
jgi:membrane fusion protein, heavy metal efflux system